MAGRWVGIKDIKVLRVGMECRTCLDNADPMYEDRSDDGDEDDVFSDDDLKWFEAKIISIQPGRDRTSVTVRKNNSANSSWNVILLYDNLQYFEIKVLDWDE